MGQEEEGIGAWKKDWYGIAVSKGFYPRKSEDLSEAPWGFASISSSWGNHPDLSRGRNP